MTLAWQIAALRGTKGLPKLERLLVQDRTPQAVNEMRGTLGMLSEQYGLRLVKGKKAKK